MGRVKRGGKTMVQVWLVPMVLAILAAVLFVYLFCSTKPSVKKEEGLVAVVLFVIIVAGIYVLAWSICARVSALNTLATLPAG